MNRVASVIKLDYARKQGLTGKNVGIAVMDTGISPHPDIVVVLPFYALFA